MDPIESSKERYALGRKAMDAGDLEKAVTMFMESTNYSAHFKTLELLGECLLRLNRPNEASIYLAAAATLGSKAFRARYLLAKALVGVGERDKALELLESALQLNPNYKAASEFLAELRGAG